MKRVTVNPYQIGLVFNKGAYKRMLVPGTYWFVFNQHVEVYDITKPFTPPCDLNIVLQDAQLADMLQVAEVKDNEIALQYENGLLKQVLQPGHYAYFKSVVQYSFIKVDISKVEITEPVDRATLAGKLVAPYVRSSIVENYEKAILFIDGNYMGILNSGVYYWWKNAVAINVGKVDIRQQQLELNGQEMLTKDKASLRINAYAQYRVVDVEQALLQNKEYDKQLYMAFQLALREYIGTFTLDELLEKKETIAPVIMQAVVVGAAKLGVEVAGYGIRDIILPGDVKEIMNQVLIAEKKAQANTIMRREETASTRSLLNTAKLMEDNTMLLKLKEMEYVEKIADKISSISVNGNGVLIDQLKQIFVRNQ